METTRATDRSSRLLVHWVVLIASMLLASCGSVKLADVQDPVAATRDRLRTLAGQAEFGELSDGEISPTEASLNPQDCLDAWGGAVSLRMQSGTLELSSSGPDGTSGTADDIFVVKRREPAGDGARALPPAIAVDAAVGRRIDAVLGEMDHNYGGTLVCDPADAALDSAAFVQRYLRRFARTPDLHDYGYRFERLLSRLSAFPAPLDDARLDADVWSAYRAFEIATGGTSTFRDGNVISGLDSARDLLWTYLGVQARRIRDDAPRRSWWIDRLCVDPALPCERLARTFAILQLVTSAQANVATAPIVKVEGDPHVAAGAAGLAWFAARLGLGWQVWGVDPASLPAPRVDEVNVSGRMSSVELASVIDQESWSQKRQRFSASFWTPVGRRSGYARVVIPHDPSDDGLFFHVLAGTLHVWPKARMADAGARMLAVAGFLDAAGYAAVVERMGAGVLEAGGGAGAPPATPAVAMPSP